jgi:hypothetical protein
MVTRQKRCEFCGRFFIPDYRIGPKQKSCNRPECRKERKRTSQASWTKKNEGYFQGRYAVTRRWLEAHPHYKREWRRKRRGIQDEIGDLTATKSVRLLLPAKWFIRGIQDTMLKITLIDSDTYLGTDGEVVYKTRLASTGS